ncbi:MAG: (Fe-S)-binding protein [Bacteroidetes bacterium]|nr:(Fe-S)-binding protein [Bacteroidota bacterium]
MVEAKYQPALDIFDEMMHGKLKTHLNSCVHCGLCGESCHYYLTHREDKYIPGKKVDLISAIYRRYYTLLGKTVPKWVGAKDLNNETVAEMVDLIYGACTMCGRCSMHCSIGVDIAFLVRAGRSMLVEIDKVVPGLQSTVNAALNTGNNMGIPKDELVDTIEWIAEDLQMEMDDEKATIPLDKKGAKMLYTLNPREPKFFPLSISAAAKIFYAADEDWTLSADAYDVTNYCYFSGDDKGGAVITQRLVDKMAELGCETLALAECGHGFRANRWEGSNYINKAYPFKVISIVELIADYIRTGKIKLDPTKNTKRLTVHDPCNMVREGGVIEEQRFILKQAVSDFVEMTPNRENNFCCGGGGGQLAMSEFADRRIKAGQIKADQIKKTEAKVVATPCHNCIDQLMELNKEYKMGIEMKSIAEIVADAIIL